MPDKILTCRDCNATFTFTTSEQDFFASKGFTNQPGRCPTCRSARKDTRGGSGGSGGFGGGSSNRGERRETQMYPAVCSQCGKDTQVPFQPRGDKPVYCSTCFEAQRGPRTGDRRGGVVYHRPRSGRARWPSRSSKPVRPCSPRLGRFDSYAAPLGRKRHG